jgi:hypothetical protein
VRGRKCLDWPDWVAVPEYERDEVRPWDEVTALAAPPWWLGNGLSSFPPGSFRFRELPLRSRSFRHLCTPYLSKFMSSFGVSILYVIVDLDVVLLCPAVKTPDNPSTAAPRRPETPPKTFPFNPPVTAVQRENTPGRELLILRLFFRGTRRSELGSHYPSPTASHSRESFCWDFSPNAGSNCARSAPHKGASRSLDIRPHDQR